MLRNCIALALEFEQGGTPQVCVSQCYACILVSLVGGTDSDPAG